MLKRLKEVCIVAGGRSPQSAYKGSYSTLDATSLASETLVSTLTSFRINPRTIDEFYLGNNFSLNLGQNPAKQVINKAKYPDSIITSTISKVCSSGLFACTLACSSIAQGYADVVAAGGVEIMSNVPYSYPRLLKMSGAKTDELLDGLTDAFHKFHIEEVGELCADKYGISREVMDEYAKKSYEKAANAWKNQKFSREVFPIKGKDGLVYMDFIKPKGIFEELKSAFRENGKITAGNAAPISDGAAMLVFASRKKAEEMNWPVLATVLSFAHADQASLEFPTSPSLALKKALNAIKLKPSQVDLYEINEPLAVVGIINSRLLEIDENKVNIYGGALAIGHPIGCSGARILVTLINALIQENKSIGAAGICNYGGGGTAMVIKKEAI